MKEYELDKSTGEVIWVDNDITPTKIKDILQVTEELAKHLYDCHQLKIRPIKKK